MYMQIDNNGYSSLSCFIINQIKNLTLCSRAFYNDTLSEFEEFVTKMFGYDKVLPMNTGAEGVETAMKFVRRWAYDVKKVPENCAKIIFPHNNFAGRTFGAISATTDPESYGGYGPLLPGIVKIPFDNLEALEVH